MKKGRFLWSAHRITEKQKAGKARNIKEKRQLKNFNMASRRLVALRSSASVNFYVRDNFIRFTTPHDFGSGEFFYQITETLQNSLFNMNNKNRIGSAFLKKYTQE